MWVLQHICTLSEKGQNPILSYNDMSKTTGYAKF